MQLFVYIFLSFQHCTYEFLPRTHSYLKKFHPFSQIPFLFLPYITTVSYGTISAIPISVIMKVISNYLTSCITCEHYKLQSTEHLTLHPPLSTSLTCTVRCLVSGCSSLCPSLWRVPYSGDTGWGSTNHRAE